VASLSQGRTAAAQCGLFTYKSVPVIFEPPCTRNIAQSVTTLTVYPHTKFQLPNSKYLSVNVVKLRAKDMFHESTQFYIIKNYLNKYVEIKYQLDATEVFIADLTACSTCFGHHYAHHQEPKSIIQWLLPVVFRAVVFQVAGLVWS